MIDDLRSPDTFDSRLGERASANVTPCVQFKIHDIFKGLKVLMRVENISIVGKQVKVKFA